MRKLTDQSILSVLNLMGEIQCARGIVSAVANRRQLMQPPEDSEYLYLTIPIDLDVVEVHEMNRELTKAIVERLPGGAFPEGLVTAFVKFNPSLQLSD